MLPWLLGYVVVLVIVVGCCAFYLGHRQDDQP